MRKLLTYEENNPIWDEKKKKLVDDWQEYEVPMPEDEVDDTIAMLKDRKDDSGKARVRNIKTGGNVPDELTTEERLEACEQAIKAMAFGEVPNAFLATQVNIGALEIAELPKPIRGAVEMLVEGEQFLAR